MSIAPTPPKAPRSRSSCATCRDRRVWPRCLLSRPAITAADRAFPLQEPQMSALRYTKDHEWIRQDGDIVVIGITDYAQSQLGDVGYVELPEIGRRSEQGNEAAVVESAKPASEAYAPVS